MTARLPWHLNDIRNEEQVATFETGESWSTGAADTVNFTQGSQSRKLTSTGAAVTSVLDIAASDFSDGQYFEVDVYIDDLTKFLGLQIILDKDLTGSNYAGIQFLQAVMVAGWNRLVINKVSMTLAGTFVTGDFAAVEALRLIAQAQAANTVNVSFDDWRLVSRRAHVMIEFDDGLKTVHKLALPIVESYGFKIGYWLTVGQAAAKNVNYELPRNLRRMHRRGHVIGFHTHLEANYATASYDEIIADMQPGQRQMQRWGLPVDHYASAEGYVTADVNTAMREEFKSARRHTQPSTFGHHDSPVDFWNLWGFLPNNATSLATFQGWVDTCVAQERGMMLAYHDLDPVADPTNGILPSVFDTHMAYIRTAVDAGNLRAITRNDLLGMPRPGAHS